MILIADIIEIGFLSKSYVIVEMFYIFIIIFQGLDAHILCSSLSTNLGGLLFVSRLCNNFNEVDRYDFISVCLQKVDGIFISISESFIFLYGKNFHINLFI